MKSLFSRDVALFGRPLRVVGLGRPILADVTAQGAPEASPPPSPDALVRQKPGFESPAYPGRSAFSGPCPVCH